MPKTISQSQRFYYDELANNEAECIHHDLQLYNRMFRYVYRKFYDHTFHHVTVPKDFQKELKKLFGTSDYMPLSVINDVKAMIKTSIQTQSYHLKRVKRELRNIKLKVQETEMKRNDFLIALNSLIAFSKGDADDVVIPVGYGFRYDPTRKLCIGKGVTLNLYLFEVQIVKPELKKLKTRLKLLQDKIKRKQQEIVNYSKHPKQVCFGGGKLFKAQYTQEEYVQDHQKWRTDFLQQRNHRMSICGRRQGKYGNNLFKLDVETGTLLYRGVKESITLPVIFHYQKELLEKRVRQKHNTPHKAICYVIESKEEYFIFKAVLETEEIPSTTTTMNGVIGVDINVDHIALCEINEHGNIVNTKVIPYELKGRSKNQRRWTLCEAGKAVVSACVQSNKTLIVEDLEFGYKKTQMQYKCKKRNQILSSFAYRSILSILRSRATRNAVEVQKVDPAYTSKIGQQKYQKAKGLSSHVAASFVIARRGLGFSN